MKHFYIDPKMLFGGIVYTAEKQEIVHLSLQKGNTVPDYVWTNEVNLFVIEGEVELHLETETRVLNARELVVIEPFAKHKMLALENSQILVIKIK